MGVDNKQKTGDQIGKSDNKTIFIFTIRLSCVMD